MENKKLLFSVTLDDCRIDTFRSGGKGGQNQNKRDTGVRIVHLASGAVGESREERTQLLNKKKAFKKMATSKKFRDWNKIEAARRSGWDIEEQVNIEMSPSNIKIETKDSDGRWEVWSG